MSKPYAVKISNVAYDATWQDVRAAFKKNNVDGVRKVEIYKDDDGKSKGTGIVEFSSKAAAEEAVKKMADVEIQGRILRISVGLKTQKAAKETVESTSKVVYVANLPYDVRWQDVKDMFRNEVGVVSRVQLMNDGSGRGLVEFETASAASEAVERVDGIEWKGRTLVVQKGELGHLADKVPAKQIDRRVVMSSGNKTLGETYGLSVAFLDSIGINEPIHSRVFVSNLSFEVDEKKVREIFKLAGKIVLIEMPRDKEGKTRGYAFVEFAHPVFAVQAISMFDGQILLDREMSVKLAKKSEQSDDEALPSVLPAGLMGVGMGLGPDGRPILQLSDLPSRHVDEPPRSAEVDQQATVAAAAKAALDIIASQISNNVGLGSSINSLAGIGLNQGLNQLEANVTQALTALVQQQQQQQQQSLIPIPAVLPQSLQPQQVPLQQTGFAQPQVVHDQQRQDSRSLNFGGFDSSQTMAVRSADFEPVVQTDAFGGSDLRRAGFGQEEFRRQPMPPAGQNLEDFSSIPKARQQASYDDPFRQDLGSADRPPMPLPPRIGQFRQRDQEESHVSSDIRRPFRTDDRFGHSNVPIDSGDFSDDVAVIAEMKAGLHLPTPTSGRSIQDRLGGANKFANRQGSRISSDESAVEPSKGRYEFEAAGSRPSQQLRSIFQSGGQKRPLGGPAAMKPGLIRAPGAKLSAESLKARASIDPDDQDWEADRQSRHQPGFGGGAEIPNQMQSKEADTVIITNLPDDLDWQELGSTFSICGDVKTAVIKNRGTGIVRFYNPGSAKRALTFNKSLKWGRQINVGIF